MPLTTDAAPVPERSFSVEVPSEVDEVGCRMSVAPGARVMPLVRVTVSPAAPPANCSEAVALMARLLKVTEPAVVVLLLRISSVRWVSDRVPQLVLKPLTSMLLPPPRKMLRSSAAKDAPACSVPPFSSTCEIEAAGPVMLPSAASSMTRTVGAPLLPMMMLP